MIDRDLQDAGISSVDPPLATAVSDIQQSADIPKETTASSVPLTFSTRCKVVYLFQKHCLGKNQIEREDSKPEFTQILFFEMKSRKTA